MDDKGNTNMKALGQHMQEEKLQCTLELILQVSTGGMDIILSKDIPSFSIFTTVVESYV